MKRIILVLILIALAGSFILLYPHPQPQIIKPEIQPDFSAEQIVIPVRAHIIKDPSGLYSSSRDKDNILVLFGKANNIWSQADVYFRVEEIVITEVSFDAIPDAINGNYRELYEHNNFNRGKVNAFFIQSLNGLNGLALPRINSILVADYTSVHDYRATAHEFGHLLGLNHIEPEDRLLARGHNGELLIPSEILLARENALKLLQV